MKAGTHEHGVDAAATLAQLDGVLRDSEAAPVDRRDAALALHDMFSDLTGLPKLGANRDSGAEHVETELVDGVALSPMDAALCLHDYVRTWAFAEGARRAIEAARIRFPGERIRVLYAGTGPFAPLAVLQVPHFSAADVGFTLVDVHSVSTEATRSLFTALGATDYVDEWATADATRWSSGDGELFHVVIAEVMQRALAKEPQVAVSRQMCTLLHPDGFLVPERISLELALFDPSTTFQDNDEGVIEMRTDYERLSLGSVFELTAQTARSMVVTDEQIELPSVGVPATVSGDSPLNILTQITTFDGVTVTEGQSGLTTIEPVSLPSIVNAHDCLVVSYQLGEHPKLNVRIGSR